eukprot:TRINITY_DN1146_c0_g1_i6.p1 TRINITY_DN1146_c0_g1~~TRINITY_DN1146_c0_g1_i6.p1  ORF type:complete len:486 (+),score=100.97 TRINITY_DN1146_c0_g1_i6:320-1777(+)
MMLRYTVQLPLKHLKCGTKPPLLSQRFFSSSSSSHQQPSPPISIKPHINYKDLKSNADIIRQNISNRKSGGDINKTVALYDQFRQLQHDCEMMRSKRNEIANTLKNPKTPDKASLIEEGKLLKEKLMEKEKQERDLEMELIAEGMKIPNYTHPEVPIGPESNATVLKLVGEKRVFSFPPLDHLTIGKNLGLIDFVAGAKSTGQKFYYLMRDCVMLEFALIQWSLDRISKKGFLPMLTPDMVHPEIVEGCGFQPKSESTQIYWVKDMNLCLSATSELTLAGMHSNSIIAAKDLPIKMVGFSHCFRAETGGMGLANKGLYRVHQFSKVEMFVICPPDPTIADQLHKEMLDIQIELFSELGLHFKVLDMPTEDLGAPAYRKFDIEAWMPGRGLYGEISSTSNCTDYQSRRLNIRAKFETKPEETNQNQNQNLTENKYVYTLNGTGCAVPRMILAILENFQQEDGSVIIPTVLRSYLGGTTRKNPLPSS